MIQNTVHKLNQTGSILLAFVITLPFLILIVTLYTDLAVSSLKVARRDQMHTHAQLAADAGVDEALRQINQSSSWSGTGGEQENMPVTDGVRTTYQLSVSDVDADQKILTSIGRSYLSGTLASTIEVLVELRGYSSGQYSIVSGAGGLIMDNSSKIINGSVYVNGGLTMSNTSQIGLSTLPVNVKVAHQSCPTSGGPSYPQICSSGQPIVTNDSSHIYGNVEANNQTDGSGMSDNGLQAPIPRPIPPNPAGIPAIAFPNYNREAQKTAATNYPGGGVAASCSLGAKTWPADTKIVGDVTVDGLCAVTVEGNVWITGKLDIKNSGSLIVKSGLTQPPVIMVDGANGVKLSNGSSLLPNASLVGFRVITYFSKAACSPDCADVIGQDLYDSKDQITIEVTNSASGAQTEFYARWTKISGGNSGSVGAVAGQTIELKNSLTVTFGTTISGLGGTVWTIDSYKRQL